MILCGVVLQPGALFKAASCTTEALQPFPFPDDAVAPPPGSITAVSLDRGPPRGGDARWRHDGGYFGGASSGPLAANEESWNETRSLDIDRPPRPRSEGDFDPHHNASLTSIDSPPLLSISQVGLNGFNYGPVTPYSERAFQYQPDPDEVFTEPEPNRSRLYFNNVAQFLTYDPARLDPIREGDEYLLREAVHSEQNERASDWDVLFYTLSIIFYLANVGSDVALAVKYLSNGQWAFFALTVLFVALPALAMTIMSIVLYYQVRVCVGGRYACRCCC